jgi:NAD(P)-dependent dehydrogenase (short-subunit alcohol dehydrogenase family)
MMTKAMAIDLAPHDIRVNAVAPGPIMHEAPEKLFTGIEYASAIKKGVPMGRAGLPSEVAELISFLISDHSSYITGQVVVIDGGYTSYARLK